MFLLGKRWAWGPPNLLKRKPLVNNWQLQATCWHITSLITTVILPKLHSSHPKCSWQTSFDATIVISNTSTSSLSSSRLPLSSLPWPHFIESHSTKIKQTFQASTHALYWQSEICDFSQLFIYIPCISKIIVIASLNALSLHHSHHHNLGNQSIHTYWSTHQHTIPVWPYHMTVGLPNTSLMWISTMIGECQAHTTLHLASLIHSYLLTPNVTSTNQPKKFVNSWTYWPHTYT